MPSATRGAGQSLSLPQLSKGREDGRRGWCTAYSIPSPGWLFPPRRTAPPPSNTTRTWERIIVIVIVIIASLVAAGLVGRDCLHGVCVCGGGEQ